MYPQYPNLPLIEERFWTRISARSEFERLKKDHIHPEFDVIVFSQVWGSTALGFGGVGGCAMTKAYTTIICEINTNIYGVFFGEKLAYCITNPTNAFYGDIKRRNMAPVDRILKYIK